MVRFARMSTIKWLIFLLVFFVAGCLDNQYVFELSGKQFCIPKKHIVQNIPWIRSDGRGVTEGKAKSIFNCFTIKLKNNSISNSNCLFNPKISDFLIAQDDGNRFGFGSPGYENSTIGMVLAANDTQYTIADDGQLIVTENQKITANDRFVWFRNDGLFSMGDKPVAGKDRLLVSCSHTKTRRDAPPEMFRDMVECRREFISGQIYISYTFESTTPIPSLDEVYQLDQTIVDWLTQAECKNNPFTSDR